MTHEKEEKWSLFTGGLYSEGQFLSTALIRGACKGLFTEFIQIIMGTSQLHLISEMISELIKDPKGNILLKALIINHTKF